MTDSTPSPWSRRFGLTGLAAATLAALGAYGSGWGFWPFTTGFLIIGVALLLALIGAFGGLILLMRRRGGGALLVGGMVAATALIAIVGVQIQRGSSVPPIHDISTNLESPPQFAHIPPRADRYTGLEGGASEWRRLHEAAYGDIQPLRVNAAPAVVMARAAGIVRARGWEVAHAGTDRIEATETVSPFRFKDDIVIMATPEADGSTTRIDIRSVSRVGVSDLGVNARRVRALIADLRAGE